MKTVMPFGKHVGKPLDEIPRGYLRWALEACTNLTPTLREDMECVVAKQPLPTRPDDELDSLEQELFAIMRKKKADG